MKKVFLMAFLVLVCGKLTAQNALSPKLVQLTTRVNKTKKSELILTKLSRNLKDFEKKENKGEVHKKYTISKEADVLNMFSDIAEARKKGKLARNIWDQFGVGRLNKDKLIDGRINVDDFIGDLPHNNGPDTDIASGFNRNKNRPGSQAGRNNDMMNPAGGLTPARGGSTGDGLGGDFKNGNNGNSHSSTSASQGGNSEGGYRGQFGSSGEDAYADNTGNHTHGGANNGNTNGAEAVWTVDAKNSSYKHSGSGGFSSFVHQHSTVSNDQGYSSTTDKQAFTSENGTTITRVVVTHTQADGSSKTVATTTTKDADGNTHTTRTITERDEDGNITSQETTESNNPPQEGDDESCERPDDGYDNPSVPPNEAEKGSAVWRAIIRGGFAGGRGDHRTGNEENREATHAVSPQELQNQRGYMEPRKVGGKINKHKVFKKEQVIRKVKK